ncbi:uncharacterized protein [Medicago truncatula]|uniref:uncharacterized protein n=1 Tax=Medicago truncatula TaxID=3880 RepID=UPI001966D48B|nr:uncharacterized protein LOC120579525 [Medicago truncatula]
MGKCEGVEDERAISDTWHLRELSVNVEHFLSLEKLKVHDSKVENIFCLNEVSEQQMNFGLQDIELHNLPMITCLFKGCKNYFSLKNLTKMNIKGCEKLEFVFSTSIIMCLPQLLHIRIEECKELKHMIEDDLESKKSSNFMATKTVCFPKLKTLVVKRCKMLKYVFPISICKELPELQFLIIREANELEEIFVCEEGDEKVNIPKLEFVAFVNLPSLCQTQGIHFQAVQNRIIQNCQELSLTNAITEFLREYTIHYISDYYLRKDINSAIDHLREETRDRDTCNDDSEIEVTILTSSQGIEITVEEVTALTNTKTLKSSTYSKSLSSSSQDEIIQEGSTSGTKNDQDIQLVDLTQKSVRLSIEDIDNVASQETSQTNTNQVSLSHNIKEQFPMDDEIISKSKPSPSIISPIACQFPLIPSKDFDLYLHMESLYQQFQEVSKGHINSNENQSAQITKEFAAWIEAEAASRHKSTSSQLEVSASERLAGATLSTISETIDEPPIQLVAPKQKAFPLFS